MRNAGITRGAADAMYSPNCGINAAWARNLACPASSGSSVTVAVKVSVPYSTVICGWATRLCYQLGFVVAPAFEANT